MAGIAKIGEFLRKYQKQLEFLAIILLLMMFAFSGSIHIGNNTYIIDHNIGDVIFGDPNGNGLDLTKYIDGLWHTFTQKVNLLGS